MTRQPGIPVLFIPLTQGKQTIVDANRDDLLEWKWCLSHYGYAVRHTPKKQGGVIYMHREIMDAGSNQDVDHINGDRLDNRRANLRLCTRQENLLNRPVRSDSISGIKGVRMVAFKKSTKWQARLAQKHLGYFDTPELAAKAYDAAAKLAHGEFARLNG